MTMTSIQPSIVDIEEFTVRRTIGIKAPVDKVWAAITQADLIVQWFGQGAELSEVAVGGSGTFTFDGYGQFPVRIEELDAPRTIAYRWGNDNATALAGVDPNNSTVFRFSLEPIDEGTQLTVVESGFDTLSDPAASMESNRGGWDSELDELVAFLEGDS